MESEWSGCGKPPLSSITKELDKKFVVYDCAEERKTEYPLVKKSSYAMMKFFHNSHRLVYIKNYNEVTRL